MGAQKIYQWIPQEEHERIEEELRKENARLVLENKKSKRRVAYLEARLRVSEDCKPRYEDENNPKLKICYFISTMAILLSGATMIWHKENLLALMELMLLSVLTSGSEYARYFFTCVNRRISWDICNVGAAAIDFLGLFFFIKILIGDMTCSYPMVIYFSFVIAKKYLSLGKVLEKFLDICKAQAREQ